MILGGGLFLVVPALVLALWANYRVRSTYAKYAEVPVQARITGADAAYRILQDAGLDSRAVARIEPVPGKMTDSYDPRSRVLRLSEGVYGGRSIAALGIAAHEAGHAIQHANAYAPLALRNIVYPVCSLGSTLAFPLFLLGLFVHPALINVAIMLYALAVFFTVLTLPVEFNASRRALVALERGGYLTQDELGGARRVLGAAAMTYVAAAAMAATQLIRMILIGQSRD